MIQNKYDEISKKIQYFAGNYYHSIGISKEDLIQELWVFVLEKDLMSFSSTYIGKTLENHCNRLYYNAKKRFGASECTLYSLCFTEFDESYVALTDQEFLSNSIDKFDTFGDITLNGLLNELDDKSYQYVVVKAYLSGNFPELESKYKFILSKVKLSQDQIDELTSLKRPDTFIAKYILGYNNTTSGSFRKIRKDLKDTFHKLCIY